MTRVEFKLVSTSIGRVLLSITSTNYHCVPSSIPSFAIRNLLTVLTFLFQTPALGETVTIPWNGNYERNTEAPWSRTNPHNSGFSKLFKAGTPEENGSIQRTGDINAEIMSPISTGHPIPYIIMLHGCEGASAVNKEWVTRWAKTFNLQGIGVLLLDSFTTRHVKSTCGPADLHWARRRAEDAYSALTYLVEKNLADPDRIYLTGQSNGGTTTLVAMTKEANYHKYKFAAGFPLVPSCYSVTLKYGNYYNPMIVFSAEKDEANKVSFCLEMMKKKRVELMQLIVYKYSYHSYMINQPYRFFKGWHLAYDENANFDTLSEIVEAIKYGKYRKGVEYR